ncbi:helix-turn-helix domain-containing protein [Bacillus bingmayongensis]|uniref:helix-turn-helix domain-containing protein n=1 Tax=Bacillus bingmayongensis TaxID=1150157 RepID=UPI001C8E5EE1|nr:helix-turn-helix transcriptional regulator [Bacillus bingmayongensis]MBY0598584.1 helix-turn-helix transcriptional regulator [Bacillus bingmayongensis]
MNNSVNVKELCHLIHQIFSIPIHFLSKNKDILYQSSCQGVCSPFFSSKKEQLMTLFHKDDPLNFPLIRANDYLENFGLIHITGHKSIEGTFIVGPSVYPKLTDKMVNNLLNKSNLTIRAQDALNYYHSVPTVKKITLIHICILLHYIIYNERLDVKSVWKRNKLLEEISYPIQNPKLYISSRRQNNSNYYDITLEKRLFTAIKEGNKEKVIEYAYAFPQEDAVILSKTSQLRQQKNNGIIAITLATRYAIDGNLPSEIAFSLSELYIQTIEQLDNMYSVNRLIEDALCTFADRVKEYNTHKYSKIIISCLDYISKNIYNEITLNNLAESVGVNPSYLSKLFKNEVGIPLSEYVQSERIDEAKKLLTLTTYSLSEICAWLNFNDQSYFIKVFKKFTNMTPRQYRQKYTVL